MATMSAYGHARKGRLTRAWEGVLDFLRGLATFAAAGLLGLMIIGTTTFLIFAAVASLREHSLDNGHTISVEIALGLLGTVLLCFHYTPLKPMQWLLFPLAGAGILLAGLIISEVASLVLWDDSPMMTYIRIVFVTPVEFILRYFGF